MTTEQQPEILRGSGKLPTVYESKNQYWVWHDENGQFNKSDARIEVVAKATGHSVHDLKSLVYEDVADTLGCDDDESKATP